MLDATSFDVDSSAALDTRRELSDSDFESRDRMSGNQRQVSSPPSAYRVSDSRTVEPLESPALASCSSIANAFELKCVLSEQTASRLVEFLGDSLQVDPFASSSPHGQYRITTLSTDTSELSCFHRVAGYARRKYRVRRYGNEEIVYLERKTRRGSRVQKIRSVIPGSELARLGQAVGSDGEDIPQLANCFCEPSDSVKSESPCEWAGAAYQSQLERRALKPACLMTYERQAWFGQSENGAVRFTLDHNLQGQLTSNWTLDVSESTMLTNIISDDEVICEFKFRDSLPQIFKAAIQEFSLDPGGFSKYRNCMSVLMKLDRPVDDSKTSGVNKCQNG